MKVFLNYTDHADEALHKTLKITLPKSWKNGPTSKLLNQFVESYNTSLGEQNPLSVDCLHLALREGEEWEPLPSDAITIEVIPDRSDVFVMHGPSTTLAEIESKAAAEKKRKKEEDATMARCTHFGCKKRFPKGGPYPDCQYHAAPPVFHETVKYWSCCPDKKAYDWNDFELIPGCLTGKCSEVKEQGKLFLGGTDMRAQAGENSQLRSIDDFNKAQAAGGTDAAPVLDRLRKVMEDLGIEKELYDQVVDGMKEQLKHEAATDAQLLDLVVEKLGSKLKAAMKAIAVEQLRIQ